YAARTACVGHFFRKRRNVIVQVIEWHSCTEDKKRNIYGDKKEREESTPDHNVVSYIVERPNHRGNDRDTACAKDEVEHHAANERAPDGLMDEFPLAMEHESRQRDTNGKERSIVGAEQCESAQA